MGITVKVYLNAGKPDEEIRRFVADEYAMKSFSVIRDRIAFIFPSLAEQDFSITWTDSEGDRIVMSSDEELFDALANVKENILKVYIVSSSPQDIEQSQSFERIHSNVVCNSCSGTVQGSRFRCLQCDDYNLCATCHNKDVHSHHDMLKMVNPDSLQMSEFWKKIWKKGKMLKADKCMKKMLRNGDKMKKHWKFHMWGGKGMKKHGMKKHSFMMREFHSDFDPSVVAEENAEYLPEQFATALSIQEAESPRQENSSNFIGERFLEGRRAMKRMRRCRFHMFEHYRAAEGEAELLPEQFRTQVNIDAPEHLPGGGNIRMRMFGEKKAWKRMKKNKLRRGFPGGHRHFHPHGFNGNIC